MFVQRKEHALMYAHLYTDISNRVHDNVSSNNGEKMVVRLSGFTVPGSLSARTPALAAACHITVCSLKSKKKYST